MARMRAAFYHNPKRRFWDIKPRKDIVRPKEGRAVILHPNRMNLLRRCLKLRSLLGKVKKLLLCRDDSAQDIFGVF